MNRTFVMVLILCASLLVSGHAICEEKNTVDGQSSLNELIAKLQANKISNIQILWLDPSLESRATITPAELEKLYSRKLDLRAPADDTTTKTLVEALRATSLSAANPEDEGDVRWAVKFYVGGSKAPARAIYLDGSGENGKIACASYTFNQPLFNWLNANFFAKSVARESR